MYVHEVFAIPIIMQIRLSKLETIRLISHLRFNQINSILKNEHSVVIPLLKAFPTEKIKLQHKALENERVKTVMLFYEQELVVKIDKKGHIDKNQKKENERQVKIEKLFN